MIQLLPAFLSKDVAVTALKGATSVERWNEIRSKLLAFPEETEGDNARILASLDAEGLIVKVLGRDSD